MTIDAQERAALAGAVRDAASAGPREFLAKDGAPPQRDGRLWNLLTHQMGMAGLLIAEEHGGAGADVAEAALVLEELARRLAVVPALSSIATAASFLRVVATHEAAAVLEELAAGAITATVAWPSPDGYDVAPVLTASGSAVAGGKVAVNGTATFVVDGLSADIVLAPARCGEIPVVVRVEGGDLSVQRKAMTAMDLTRELATLEFTDAPGTVLGKDVDLQAALDLALVFIAAEQVGIAQHCHDSAVTWAKERVQFDRLIGQFQAIKHQLVDLLMALELARSSLDVAVSAADAYLGDPTPSSATTLSMAASVAKARCGEAAMLVADESLHILGGIGFTWEHDAHLYFRRAKTLEVLLGTPAAHRRRLTKLLLADAAHA
jgi:alkylation response protein AidB-like acyl-CoA dehydrogenase